MVVELPYTDE